MEVKLQACFNVIIGVRAGRAGGAAAPPPPPRLVNILKWPAISQKVVPKFFQKNKKKTFCSSVPLFGLVQKLNTNLVQQKQTSLCIFAA